MRRPFEFLFLLTAFCCTIASSPMSLSQVAAQSVVKLSQADGKFQLQRNGKPYLIRGVGGDNRLAELSAAGGNSIRTWGTDDLKQILDRADQHGLTVCAGIWLGHTRHGFDYQNEQQVLEQLEKSLRAVRQFKDHPALLMWCIGNEMEGDGKNPAIWYAVDHIAREIKKIDPNHPTMTVIAELGENENKLHNLKRFCPHIDIVGVNSYGGITTLPKRYRKVGIDKPYVVTEHGPLGPWEVGKTRWGSPLEPTSTDKGSWYAKGHQIAVSSQPGVCLGSYAFLWGNKQETTATWFGMFLPDGSRLAAADAMIKAWTGTPPPNACPRINSLKLDRNDNLKPGDRIQATLVADDPENDKLEISWVLRSDTGVVGGGGDFQSAEATYKEAVVAEGSSAVVTIPSSGGGYRLFAYVRDGNGGAAVANAPFYVDAPVKSIPAPRAKLPLVVYADGAKSPYIPSGYMGNTEAVKMNEDSTEQPRAGKTCLKVEYLANDDWGGVLWQSPANDWDGSLPGGFNLEGASALEFFVRGQKGGERVSFVLGVIEGDKPYRDSAKAELKEVRLTTEWQKMRIPLNGLDLSRIKTGFGWSLAAQGKPVTFFLDDVRYVAD